MDLQFRLWDECCGEGRIKPSSSSLASGQGITGKEVGGSVGGQCMKQAQPPEGGS